MFTSKVYYYCIAILSTAVSFASSDHNKLARFVCVQEFDRSCSTVLTVEQDDDLSYTKFLITPTRSTESFISVADNYDCRVVLCKPINRVKVVPTFPDDSEDCDLLADVDVSYPYSTDGVLIGITDINLNGYSFISE